MTPEEQLRLIHTERRAILLRMEETISQMEELQSRSRILVQSMRNMAERYGVLDK